MRGAGDHFTIGDRIAFYRRRRGMTQPVLAGLVGRSVDWVSKVERGERAIRRLDVLTEVARALRIEVGDLIGQPVLIEDSERHDDIPAIRDALMAPRRLSKVLFGTPRSEPADPVAVGRYAEAVWADYQAGRLGNVIAALPDLIRTAQHLEDEETGWPASARIHHLAATTLSKVGEVDLAWIAAERAMHAADRSDDLLVLASAARAGTHALLATGRYSDAMQLGITAADWLHDRLDTGDPAALSLFGMLHLRTAVAAAREQDRSTTVELLARAEWAADQLGSDANHWQTCFGPTNLRLHRLSTALDLGDVTYVTTHGPSVDASRLPAERNASHLIDLARAFSLIADDSSALDTLLSAEAAAPTLVRHNPAVRETLKSLTRRAPLTGGTRLLALADRCNAIR